MTQSTNQVASLLVLVCVAGCGVSAEGLSSESAPLVIDNGEMQNGEMQNGEMQNGEMQNGAALQLTGANLFKVYRLLTLPDATHPDPNVTTSNVVAVPNVRLDKGTLTDGTRSGAAFVGHIIEGMMSNGVKAWIYIEAVIPTSDPEVPRYIIKAYHQFVPAPGQTCTGPNGNCVWLWDYACGKNGDSVVPAIAIGGQWDYQQGVPGGGRKLIEQSSASYDRQITFACTTGAIGKCVEKAHYKPWAPAAVECASDSSLLGFHCQQPTQELLHEACVRMVRADYCGDGQPHTVNGMKIDVGDQSTINTLSPYSRTSSNGGLPFGHEAEWTANGARCLSSLLMTRVSEQGAPQTLSNYLTDTPYCRTKWGTPANPTPAWDDCFKLGSTYYFANVPWSASGPTMDMHNRVLIQNKSVCVDDGTQFDSTRDLTNPLRYDNPWCSVCLPNRGMAVTCPLQTFPG